MIAMKNELDDRQLKAIELLATGETVSNTANLVGVNRKTIAEWKKQDKFKAELDKYVASLKSGIEQKILTNINPMMDRLIKIALKSDSDKTSLDAIIYAINRLCGTPTNKTQDISSTSNDDKEIKDIDSMLKEIDNKENNIIDLPKKVSK